MNNEELEGELARLQGIISEYRDVFPKVQNQRNVFENKCDQLEAEVQRLTAALHEVVFAARTKISMKEFARKALFYHPEGDSNASSDPPKQQ